MADEAKKKKFVVEEVVGDEEVHSEDLEKVPTSNTDKENIDDKPTEDTKDETLVLDSVKENSGESQVQETAIESSEDETAVETNEEAPMSAEPTPQTEEKKTNMKLVIVLTAFFALILGGVAGGVLVFLSNSNPMKEAEASPTPIATVAPTATPEPEVDKQSVTVNIQNGSGIAGEGGKMSEYLTDEGFKVGTVGNASSFDHDETIIQAKSTVEQALIDALTKSLSAKYKMGTSTKLTTGSNDIIVIIGSEKSE